MRRLLIIPRQRLSYCSGIPAGGSGRRYPLVHAEWQALRYKGKYAAFQRLRLGDDLRSNISAGGKKAKAIITDIHLHLAEIFRPKLVQDGIFLVGLDIVGDKLMEINVFSPGGLGSAQQFEKVNFNEAVVNALSRKVAYMGHYHRNFANEEMAML